MAKLTRRQWIAAFSSAALAQVPKKTNVLFIASDDMNNTLGCYGHPIVKTPNIDALASGGVRFDRAYCQFPLCGPSRASLLTGRRPDSTRVLENNVDFRDHIPDVVTLPQLFKNNGYFSAREGKMFHMNVPNEVGLPRFQDSEKSWNHSGSPQGLENKSPGTPSMQAAGQWAMRSIMTADGNGQADVNAADHAIALMERHRNDAFFIGLGFVRPHLPFVAPARFFDLYPASTMSLAKNPPDDLDDIPAAHKGVRPNQWNHMKMNEAQQRESLRGYYASTSFMDEQVGRVLKSLDQLGLAKNTVVFFWGDHGWHLGEHTKWQKMSLMENAARAPLIVRAPGRKGNGRASKRLVEFVEMHPTIAELCGLRPPEGLEGQSFVPLLDNPDRRWKRAAFTQILFEDITGRSLRTERYRYTKWQGMDNGEELYDHDKDAGEFRNLAKDPAHKRALDEMRGVMEKGWRGAVPA